MGLTGEGEKNRAKWLKTALKWRVQHFWVKTGGTLGDKPIF